MPYLNLEFIYYWIYRLILWPLGLASPPAWFGVLWFVLFVIFWVAIIILGFKIYRLRAAEIRGLNLMLKTGSQSSPPGNKDWERVLKHLESENSAEWKLAVIEADKMLDKLAQALKPHGENLGERLKSIEPSDFLTLNEAWEAHKLRNRIAHEPGFVLNKREAQRAINLFRQVFEEFEYV